MDGVISRAEPGRKTKMRMVRVGLVLLLGFGAYRRSVTEILIGNRDSFFLRNKENDVSASTAFLSRGNDVSTGVTTV